MTRRSRLLTNRRRHGAVIVAALVCLLVVMTMLGSMLQGTLRNRRQLHRERDFRQTELILQAGLQRAVYRLANEPDYRGETWSLPAEMITGQHAGQVTIELSGASDAQSRRVEVAAEYPADRESSIRRSHTLTIPVESPQSQE